MKAPWSRILQEEIKVQVEVPEQTQTRRLPATRSLGTNLQRAVDAYNRRIEALTGQINVATTERADVIKARDAAAFALKTLVGGG